MTSWRMGNWAASLARGDFGALPKVTDAGEQRRILAISDVPKKPDFDISSIQPVENLLQIEGLRDRTVTIKRFRGSIALIEEGRQQSIEAATLSLTYWPDRELIDAYTEIVMTNTLIKK